MSIFLLLIFLLFSWNFPNLLFRVITCIRWSSKSFFPWLPLWHPSCSPSSTDFSLEILLPDIISSFLGSCLCCLPEIIFYSLMIDPLIPGPHSSFLMYLLSLMLVEGISVIYGKGYMGNKWFGKLYGWKYFYPTLTLAW